MSKLTIGLVAAGAALASAAALSSLAGSGSATHDVALNTGAAVAPPGSATVSGALTGSKDQAAALKRATAVNTTKAQATTAVPVKAIRSVSLQLPTVPSKVGANVMGTIQVVDTAGKVVTPVSGAAVALQQKRGTAFITISDGRTDASGLFAVSFMSTANTTWRAELTPVTGPKVYSNTVTTLASASVTWAARPDMDLAPGATSTYAFRVKTEVAATAHLEMANSKTPTNWVALKSVVVPPTGVVSQVQKFPTAGTWLLRGATAANATNAPGYTTALTITVR